MHTSINSRHKYWGIHVLSKIKGFSLHPLLEIVDLIVQVLFVKMSGITLALSPNVWKRTTLFHFSVLILRYLPFFFTSHIFTIAKLDIDKRGLSLIIFVHADISPLHLNQLLNAHLKVKHIEVAAMIYFAGIDIQFSEPSILMGIQLPNGIARRAFWT